MEEATFPKNADERKRTQATASELMDAALRQRIEANEIGAICLDTEVFKAKQLALEHGLLRRMAQFANSEIAVVLPDVIADEVKAHLMEAANEARNKFNRALRMLQQAQLLSLVDAEAAVPQLLKNVANPGDLSNAVDQRLGNWVKLVGASIIKADDHVTVDQVMRRYFDGKAPFAESGPKKYEFPDAVALITLENWARQQERKVLVVSNDPDWGRYCADSSWLFLARDLADALSAFQIPTANYAARRIAELSDEGDPLELKVKLLKVLQDKEDLVDLDADAESQFEYEFEEGGVHFTGVELPGTWGFEAVDYRDGKLFVQVSATGLAKAHTSFSLRKWDGVDSEYLSMGSTTITTDERIDFEALITVGGKIPEQMEVMAIEIQPLGHRVDAGEIEPDWMSDPQYHD